MERVMNEREMKNRRKGWRQTCCAHIKRGQKQKKGRENEKER